MKASICTLALLAFYAVEPASAKIATVADFFPNCSQVPDAAGHVLTVDPSAKASGAYPNIAAALQAAKPGDTVALMSGDYGALDLPNMKRDGFVTIAAAPNQTPRFTKMNITGASHLRLTGLTVSGPPGVAQGILVQILDGDNIVFDHNTVQSHDGNFDWKASNPGQPDSPTSGISARQGSCVSIMENKIHNVFHGIDFGGDQSGDKGKYFLVSGNSIDNFAGDGIEHYGSHVRIEKNRITDGHDICNNQCVHQDGIQGWNYNHLPVHNSDVVIDGNVVISEVTPNLAMPADMLQGITIFDGDWSDVHVFNNVVLVNAWHGITLNWVRSGSIINNTLGSTNPTHNNWIMVNRPKDIPADAPPTIIVRNNVVPAAMNRNSPALVAYWSAGNFGLKNADAYADAFVKFDRDRSEYDMHLAKGSPLIGAGVSDGAPPADIDGRPRKPPVDIGAYAYQR